MLCLVGFKLLISWRRMKFLEINASASRPLFSQARPVQLPTCPKLFISLARALLVSRKTRSQWVCFKNKARKGVTKEQNLVDTNPDGNWWSLMSEVRCTFWVYTLTYQVGPMPQSLYLTHTKLFLYLLLEFDVNANGVFRKKCYF